jgi:hypothetical protein
VKAFLEEIGQQEQRGPLVEAVAIFVYQTASSSCEVVLLNHSDSQASFGKTCRAGDAAGTSA